MELHNKMETENERDALLLVMRQQQSRYGVPAACVEEIITMPAITAIPRQPAFLRGIFSYKGRVIPVLSLQALCGCGAGESEAVCVVLRAGDTLLALTADNAESLITDTGERMRYDETLMNGELVRLSCVLPGDPAVFVLDLEKMVDAAANRLNAAAGV